MEYLGIALDELKKKGAYHTAKEIESQPKMWRLTYDRIKEEKDTLNIFIKKALKDSETCIIHTGAGSSAFVGEALAGIFQKHLKLSSRSVATTDILTHPDGCFIRSKPTLLISFARSGDSPESLATLELARDRCDNLHQLIITCNKNGELAKHDLDNQTYVLLLPEETNDLSLAMTSSFSSMLLAGLMILHLQSIEKILPAIENMCSCGSNILNNNLSKLSSIAALKFNRAVFLGSGPLFGIAHESHLKVQELSDGNIIGKYDSFLGFRHGPRAVVDNHTLIMYLLSINGQAKRYETDLIKSINDSPIKATTVCVGRDPGNHGLESDYVIDFPGCLDAIPEEFFTVLYILPAQIVGFFKSLELNLEPDSPSKGGEISRVVQGVTIY